jgi:carboxyl-terminal processing protease
MIRALGMALAALAACAATWACADSPRERREDFDAMWRAIDARYAYFDAGHAPWRRARAAWRTKAMAAKSRGEFVAALEGALLELHDDHVTLSEVRPRSPRRVPYETDVWAAWKDGRAAIESVRVAEDADFAGLHPGDIVLRVAGVAVEQAARRLLGRGEAKPGDLDWALRHVLAGPRAGTLSLELGGAQPRQVQVERSARPPTPAPALTGRRIGEARDLGYLRLRNLADERLLDEIDRVLAPVTDLRALILDLREAIPGPRSVTLALLARFATREGPWQIREGPDGKRDADRIAPAPRRSFNGPIVVLVDLWTAGEAEALAAGLVAVASARLVGTPMAGLRGEIHTVRLPHSGIEVRFPGEKVFTPDGTPRESLRPAIEIDPAAPSGGPGDPILYQAMKLGSDPNFANSGSTQRREP